MGPVDMYFEVLQSWRTPDGEEWNNGCLQTRWDEYEWRDYYRNEVGGKGPPRYQLWHNERWTYETFDPKSMKADKEQMIEAARAAEKRAAERAATKANGRGRQDVRMLLGALRHLAGGAGDAGEAGEAVAADPEAWKRRKQNGGGCHTTT
jgi:hypothetical protein